MSHPPLRRFLGLDESANDYLLLGLSEQVALTADRISKALEERLSHLERHPGAQSPAATDVRKRLGEAAGRLMVLPRRAENEPVPTTPNEMATKDGSSDSWSEGSRGQSEGNGAPTKDDASTADGPVAPGNTTVAQLTEFDRTVLSILVGSGGWNAESRGRLIGLASQRGLKPQALMRIVSGLAQLLHGGGFESVAGAKHAISVAAPHELKPLEPTRLEATMNQVAATLATEFRGETSGARTRVAIYFSVGTIFLIGLFALALSLPSPVAERVQAERAQQEALEKERAAAILAASEAAKSNLDSMRDAFSGSNDGSRNELELVPQKIWDLAPNFHADARPRTEILRAHDASEWIEPLELLARKASLPQGNESAAIRREYSSFVDDAGRCWPFFEPAMRAELAEHLIEPIATAAAPELRTDLIALLAEQLQGVDHPLDIWRTSWASGLLGVIAADPQQPEAARMEASETLMLDLGSRRRMRAASEQPLETAIGRKLDVLAPKLVALTLSDPNSAYVLWEYWIEAQRAVRRGASLDAAWLDAVDVLLREGDGLERSGPQVNVLGRLVSELDFSARANDPELVRANVRSWLEDDSIPADHLWVLSSMLAQSVDVPWWDATFVVSPNASISERAWYADLVDASWPQLSATDRPRGIPVPSDLLDRLNVIVEALGAIAEPSEQTAILYRLVTWAHVTAAAEALELGDLESALEEMRDAETMLNETLVLMNYPADLVESVGTAAGVDGAWTEEWLRARRDPASRQSALRYLKQLSGGDLGPVDSATLVNEAIRGVPRELRLLAQETIIDNYSYGPNVTLALLNAFEFAPRNQDTVDFLNRLIGVDLPALSDDTWRENARLALVRHALALRRSEMHDVDRLADSYRSILHERLDRLGGDPYTTRRNGAELAAAIVDMANKNAEMQYVADPIPATLTEMDRRRTVRWASAHGEPQQLAAELAALVDIATYQTAGLRPDLRGILSEKHSSLTSRVSIAPDVLAQLVLLERAVAELILMRLDSDEGYSG